jgi:uncharacterized protein (TIGR03000 family)
VSSGCYGGCTGSYSGYGFGCFGSYGSGGYGGGYGYGCNGYGCSGGGCHGCSGGDAYPPAYAPAPGGTAPVKPTPEPVPAPKKEDNKSTALNQARLIVELPADAKLYVDDRLTKTTSERRVFNSPELEAGETYYYILRAEVIREGRTQSETKRVLVHAGELVQTSFPNLENLVTAQAEPSADRTEANARP